MGTGTNSAEIFRRPVTKLEYVDEETLVSGSEDGTMRVWSVATGTQKEELDGEGFSTEKAEEIRMLVMLRMNREFMEYMRSTFPDTPLSEFKAADTYVRARGGLETLDDDEEDE